MASSGDRGSEGGNLAVLLCGSRHIEMRKCDIPEPDENEVVVAIKRCGICGTDLHLYLHGNCGGVFEITPNNPFAIGHECSGIVQSVGAKVKHLAPGDAVALELGVYCRRCEHCKAGRGNLCKPWSYGGLTRYVKHPADFCHKLPPGMSLEEGALMEPLAVSLRACTRAGVTPGSSVLICGAGAIGLCSLLVAKSMGATKVCITDLSPGRLQRATDMGADCTVLVDRDMDGPAITDRVLAALGGRPDYTIECCGAPPSVSAAFLATQRGGVVAPVALDVDEVKVPVSEVTLREVDVRGVFSYCGSNYPRAIAAVASGKARPLPMVTHHFKLERIEEAIQLLLTEQDKVLKVMIELD